MFSAENSFFVPPFLGAEKLGGNVRGIVYCVIYIGMGQNPTLSPIAVLWPRFERTLMPLRRCNPCFIVQRRFSLANSSIAWTFSKTCDKRLEQGRRSRVGRRFAGAEPPHLKKSVANFENIGR